MRLITGRAYNKSEATARFEEVININSNNIETGYFKVILKSTGEPVGIAKIILTKDDEAEIGYVILPDFWGKGFGSEISMKLVELSKSLQEIKSLIAIIDPENHASKKILVKCGFLLEKEGLIDGLPGEIYRLNL